MPLQIKTEKDEYGRVFYDIGNFDIKNSTIERVGTQPRKETKKKGDRNFYQQKRLRGRCPNCRMVVPAVQTVDRRRDYALVKHWCKYCNKMLHIQRYPLAEIKKKEQRWL